MGPAVAKELVLHNRLVRRGFLLARSSLSPIRNPLPIRRPTGTESRRVLVGPSGALSRGDIQDPNLRVGSTGPVIALHGVGGFLAVWRKLHLFHRAQPVEVAALEACRLSGNSPAEADSGQRQTNQPPRSAHEHRPP